MVLVTFLFGIFFFVLSLYLYLTWNFEYWKRRGVAGPRPRPFVGTFPKTALLDKNSNYINETSEIFRFVNFFIFIIYHCLLLFNMYCVVGFSYLMTLFILTIISINWKLVYITHTHTFVTIFYKLSVKEKNENIVLN